MPGRVDDLPGYFVARSGLAVDLRNPVEDIAQPLIFSFVCQPINIFEQEDAWPGIPKNAQKANQCIGARIVEPQRVAPYRIG